MLSYVKVSAKVNVEFQLFQTPSSSPLFIAITTVYFLSEAISIFDTRIIQAKQTGYLEPDYVVPEWTGIFGFLTWLTYTALLLLNPFVAIILFVIKFILKVLPVLENIGAVLMIPVVGKSSLSAVNAVRRGQQVAKNRLQQMQEDWENDEEKDADVDKR